MKKLVFTLAIAFAAVSFSTPDARSAIIVTTDLGGGVGVPQTANIGDTVTANIFMELTGSSDVAVYTFSVDYDAPGLTLLTRDENDFGPLTELDTTNPVNTVTGRAFRFDGATFAAQGATAPLGPISVATLTFRVDASPLGGLFNVTPGLFAPEDEFFASDFQDVTTSTVFSGAGVSVAAVPEPGSMVALAAVGMGGWYARRRRRVAEAA